MTVETIVFVGISVWDAVLTLVCVVVADRSAVTDSEDVFTPLKVGVSVRVSRRGTDSVSVTSTLVEGLLVSCSDPEGDVEREVVGE